MIARLAIVLALVACGKSEENAAERPAAAEREAAEILLGRSQALGRASGAYGDQLDALLEQMRAKRNLARASKDPAETAKLDAEIDALYEKGKQLEETYQAERARIQQLPDRCFVKPTPADCKLPPEPTGSN